MSAVGCITKLFGANGEVSVNLYTNFPDNFNWEEQPLFMYMDSMVVPLFCDKFIRRGASGATVRLADIDTAQRAEMLIGKELFISTDNIDDDEFMLEDLVGFVVYVANLEGVMTDFYDNDVNPLFEIEISGHKHLVPASEDFIQSIDFDNKTMRLTLPDGLLEL